MADCGITEFNCRAASYVSSAIGDALTKAAEAVLDAVVKTLASLSTLWVNVGTPTLVGGGGSGVTPGATADGAGGINTVLGWATWIAFGICVLSLTWLGVRMATGRHHEHTQHVSRLGLVLVATVLVSAAVGVVTAIVPAVRSNASPAVAFIQDSLWFYMIAIATLAVIVGAAKMAWEQRAEPGRDVVKSLMTLVVVSGAGLTAISLLTAAGDSFSVWLLNGALDCSVDDAGGNCFGENMTALLALTGGTPVTTGLGPILVIVFGLIAVLSSAVQILLMIIRAGMLVILAGVLPLSAAATNTETGRTMFRKNVGWLLAFILYKPAAAIVYATAFKLSGTDLFKDDGSGLISIITGLTLMVVALIALPALMALVAPAVSSIASSSSGGMAMAGVAGAAAAMPTGAISGGRLGGGGGPAPGPTKGGPDGSSTDGPQGSTGSPGGPGPTSSPNPKGAGSTGSPAASIGEAAGTVAAGGPVGAAVTTATQVGKAAGTIKDGVQSATETSSGEAGPDGSR